jgi:hypothetical protein
MLIVFFASVAISFADSSASSWQDLHILISFSQTHEANILDREHTRNFVQKKQKLQRYPIFNILAKKAIFLYMYNASIQARSIIQFKTKRAFTIVMAYMLFVFIIWSEDWQTTTSKFDVIPPLRSSQVACHQNLRYIRS